MSFFSRFMAFAMVSGVGWGLDFATFTALTLWVGVSGGVANFVSSYVGVTFVWFVSLKRVFGRAGEGRVRLLAFYWLFQFFSILFYSKLLQGVTVFLSEGGSLVSVSIALILAKMIVTPFNLLTNFAFMRWLSGFMRPDASTVI